MPLPSCIENGSRRSACCFLTSSASCVAAGAGPRSCRVVFRSRLWQSRLPPGRFAWTDYRRKSTRANRADSDCVALGSVRLLMAKSGARWPTSAHGPETIRSILACGRYITMFRLFQHRFDLQDRPAVRRRFLRLRIVQMVRHAWSKLSTSVRFSTGWRGNDSHPRGTCWP